MKRIALQHTAWLSLLGIMLPFGAAQAQWVHQPPPPPPQHEFEGPAPRPGYTWVPGYQRWDGHRYVWVGGRWVLPPRPRAVWVPGHWVQGAYGWRWRAGHWRA